jgi:hypothetical protein
MCPFFLFILPGNLRFFSRVLAFLGEYSAIFNRVFSMKKIKIFLSALLIAVSFNLHSQEFNTDGSDGIEESESLSEVPAPDSPPPGEERLYVITDFKFDIKGRTRPFALVNNIELKRGEEILGEANLETYIRDKTQMLVNQRVLKNNAELTYSIGEQQPDGAYPVVLNIKVEDSWNLIALPYFSYNTNTGFELTIKARDYNFFGTMNPLRVDIGYQYDENNRSSFNFEIDSSIPFVALGYNWNFVFINLFSYRPQVEEPFFFQNVTGLSVELPFKATTFTLGFEESLNLNEENADRYKERYGEFQNGLYMSSKLYGGWKVPTGFHVSRFGELTYNTELSGTFNHELPKWRLDSFRHGPFLQFYNALGFEKINWNSNYREGLSSSISLSYNCDFFRYKNNEEGSSVSFSLNGTGHFIISRFFGISSRLQYRHWFYHDPEYYESAGDNLRGILDKAIHSDYMLSLNLDFPFRVLVFNPAQWFNNDKLRFLEFELQVSPVIDLALYHDPNEDSLVPKSIAASGGLEFIVFPALWRRFYLRASIAVNIKEMLTARPFRIPGGNNREFSLTMGHFY